MNNDLISRSALKEEFAKHEDRKGYLIGDWEDIIDNAPTVEGEIEILTKEAYSDLCLRASRERPQGEWIKWSFKTFGAMGDWDYKCSNCEAVYGGKYKFCPNCGAEMGKEAEE